MLRKLLVLVVLLVGTGILFAADISGKFVSYEGGGKGKDGKLTIKAKVDDKDKDKVFLVGKDTKIYNGTDEVTGKDRRTFFKDLKAGIEVKVTYDGDKASEAKFSK